MFFRLKQILPVLIFASFTSGCASIVSGHNQPISVETGPVTGAHCTLENNKGKWYVANTPGSVVVHRSFNDMLVSCTKPGYKSQIKTIQSSTKGMAFGNVVFGGVVGAGVDMASGAAYDYPQTVSLPMAKA